jgi:retron-type reverse transcriptase
VPSGLPTFGFYVHAPKNESEFFSVMNGVKQGGILSPILFSLYIDELLEQLRASGCGCYVGTTFAGAFAYDDGIIILCPTKLAMKSQLNVALSYASPEPTKLNSIL